MSFSEQPLSILFLWHQHQPFYKDPLSNRYELPWVRLHAVKDYYDMVALLEEFPKIRANFNLVPSLLTQLDDYAQGKAHDKFVGVTLKAAVELSFEDRQFILQNFFMANWENMIDLYPRYRELLDKRGRNTTGESLTRAQNYFKEQDWRDLQTWFNLTWFDPWWRERDPLIKMLYEKGKGFSEEDKQRLIQKQLEICGLVAQKHRQMMEKGQIEITATPYYHPILPLLCDTDAARMALPQMALPKQRFCHPEDAKTQIERALEDHRERFGRRPQGMWPSEGSVSEPVAKLFMESGVRWIATDEAVLARSIDGNFDHDALYQPYQFKLGDKSLSFFFRDHELSDAIGFVYTSWNAEDAVNDFIKRLHGIREKLRIKDGSQPRAHVVPVILDGENCWEYYKNDGLPFLRLLYSRISEDPTLETVRGSDFLDRAGELPTLSKLWAGSWINSNFAIWIGHPEDNQAWDFLSRTRQFLTDHLQAHPELAGGDPAKLAWESIYIAEGSDWCWWYGDDHSSGNDEAFDYLFRKHLMNVYAVLGAKVPDDLHLPIKTKKIRSPIKPPMDFLTPQIDGKVTSYFEWQSAGLYETEAGGTGTMHRAQNLIKSIYYGFDLKNLYFRLDISRPLEAEIYKNTAFKWTFLQPQNIEMRAQIQEGGEVQLQLYNHKDSNDRSEAKLLPPGRMGRIIELSVPLIELKAPQNQPLKWTITIERDGLEQERWPLDNIFEIPYPTSETFAESWVI